MSRVTASVARWRPSPYEWKILEWDENPETNKQEPQENPKEYGFVHSIYVNNLNPTSQKQKKQQQKENETSTSNNFLTINHTHVTCNF